MNNSNNANRNNSYNRNNAYSIGNTNNVNMYGLSRSEYNSLHRGLMSEAGAETNAGANMRAEVEANMRAEVEANMRAEAEANAGSETWAEAEAEAEASAGAGAGVNLFQNSVRSAKQRAINRTRKATLERSEKRKENALRNTKHLIDKLIRRQSKIQSEGRRPVLRNLPSTNNKLLLSRAIRRGLYFPPGTMVPTENKSKNTVSNHYKKVLGIYAKILGDLRTRQHSKQRGKKHNKKHETIRRTDAMYHKNLERFVSNMRNAYVRNGLIVNNSTKKAKK
jgi:hypothetical protein